MKLYWARDVREADRIAIQEMGIPSLALMENAARSITQALLEELPERLRGQVLILCGKGNNGGDGMAAARMLKEHGHSPEVVLLGDPARLSGDASVQYQRLGPAGVPCEILDGSGSIPALSERLRCADLVLDALLGTGLGGPAAGLSAEVIRAVNESGAFVASVDIPSGLSGDAYGPTGDAVRAQLTLTLALGKPPLFTPESAPLCGEVRILDIGIPAEATSRLRSAGETLDAGWAGAFFHQRRPATHKGDAGRLLLVAGSLGKSGAAVLCARGALRSGAGLVTVATPASAQRLVAAGLPEAMTLPLPETKEGTLSMDALTPILAFCDRVDAVGMGPGLGDFPETQALARELYGRIPVPCAVDADGLNAFQGEPERLALHAGARVLTPHPGEMGRLVDLTAAQVVAERYNLAPAQAEAWQAALLLKGYRTLVAAPGEPWRLNLSGGPHMAGPGFGDVLTGIVGALLARGLSPRDAASLGAWWHGAAADLASDRLGGYGLLASECADALPVVEGSLRTP
ncbi:MAG: NAD(P)H-hydrate dehydratase [Acidobacteriota bacterium]